MAAVRTQAEYYPHFLEPRLAPGEELDAHGASKYLASALRGQVPTPKIAQIHGCEAADREDPRQPHPRQAGREAPGGGQDRRE